MTAKNHSNAEPSLESVIERSAELKRSLVDFACDERYSDVLRGYLESDSIGPLPIRRLAAAHPETADAVFRKVLRKPGFTWPDHGETLLRRRKPWYYEREPRPGVSVIGARLQELVALR
jgi:hypothetical protein